ncbi:MAG: DUF3604 domain-containing protein [Halioglobus sp.]
MLKKTLLAIAVLAALCLLALGGLTVVGKGWLGSDWASAPVSAGPRAPLRDGPARQPGDPQILFGDLHNHTSYSLDAYLFGMNAIKGGGVVTPADACDFARYCSALDFWSINDHAESLTPRVWEDTVNVIRECNAMAGDPANPDMVSFVGWEWSNSDRDDVPSHYGHKNVILRTWETGQTPLRPIASRAEYPLTELPAPLLGLLSATDGWRATANMGRYLNESRKVPVCDGEAPTTALPADCREVALTPQRLYRKLDEWGFDSLVIPHGLAWGTTNPLSGDFRDQLEQHDPRYQRLLEVFSGHGNSERFEDFQRIATDANGEAYCPPATANFTPCCQQAGTIVRARCERPDSGACEDAVRDTVAAFVSGDPRTGRKLIENTTPADWQGCGQLRNTFQPASMYVPRLAAQYTLALGFDEDDQPARVKLGLIGSSDGHQARPGSSYKETNRLLYTDHKDTGKRLLDLGGFQADPESRAFYYTGGLVAVHARGRDRDAIWQALQSREVYATSGDRILLWFDLLNGPQGESPMGSDIAMRDAPTFRVRALGAFEQQPGCPDYAVAALGKERVRSLCGGECYRAGDQRKAITRIEVVRILPQAHPGEDIAPLIEDPWRVFECPGNGTGCEAEFTDTEYAQRQRHALYYARAIQQAEPLIGGDPFGCEYDAQGNCIEYHYCIGDNASRDRQCRATGRTESVVIADLR